jgi:hypothetical protein
MRQMRHTTSGTRPRAGRRDVWVFLAEVVELPPMVWVVLAKRVTVAG